MIRFLKGKIADKEEGYVILDLNGMGFGLETPIQVSAQLPDTGTEVQLYTHLRFSEDGIYLFGFMTQSERDIFELLVSTSGLGPRMGLAILSAMPVEDFIRAVVEQNMPVLTTIPGIGKKKAERLIVELKDKIALFVSLAPSSSREESPEITEHQRIRINDAIEALISLGMKANEATKAIYCAFRELGPDTTTTDLIKLGLKYK